MYLRGGQTLISGSSVSLCGEIAEAKASVGIATREMREQRVEDPAKRRGGYYPWLDRGTAERLNNRPRIALVINGDEGMIVENRIKNQIYKQMREKFPMEKFAVMKGIDVNTFLLTQTEEERYDSRKGISSVNKSRSYNWNENGVSEKSGDNAISHQQNDIDGMPVGNRPRGLSDMRLEDYVNAGRSLSYDYVFVITMSLGHQVKYQRGFLPFFTTHTSEQNIWVRARFVDVKKGKYLYRNDLTAKGKTHNGHFNGRIYDNSVNEIMQEFMDDITVDS